MGIPCSMKIIYVFWAVLVSGQSLSVTAAFSALLCVTDYSKNLLDVFIFLVAVIICFTVIFSRFLFCFTRIIVIFNRVIFREPQKQRGADVIFFHNPHFIGGSITAARVAYAYALRPRPTKICKQWG